MAYLLGTLSFIRIIISIIDLTQKKSMKKKNIILRTLHDISGIRNYYHLHFTIYMT